MKIKKMCLDNNIIEYIVETSIYKISILNIGGAIYKTFSIDKDNNFEEINLRLPSQKDYFSNPIFMGANITRNANRINKAQFSIDGKVYTLPENEPNNNVHSSGKGGTKKIWVSNIQGNKIILNSIIESEEDGFPGNINITITYAMRENGFNIMYEAFSSSNTICNITNHSYWNLSGDFKRKITDMEIENTFKSMYKLNDESVPETKVGVGDIFVEKRIGNIFAKRKDLFAKGRGFSQTFELNKKKCVLLSDPISKRTLKIKTSYPFAVIYSQNWENKVVPNGINNGIAIEMQYMPNDININKDNSKTILRRGQKSIENIDYTFGLIGKVKHEKFN